MPEFLYLILGIIASLVTILQFVFSHWRRATELAMHIVGHNGSRFTIVRAVLFSIRIISTWLGMFCLAVALTLMPILAFGNRTPIIQSSFVVALSLGLSGMHSLVGLRLWEAGWKRSSIGAFMVAFIMLGICMYEVLHRFIWLWR